MPSTYQAQGLQQHCCGAYTDVRGEQIKKQMSILYTFWGSSIVKQGKEIRDWSCFIVPCVVVKEGVSSAEVGVSVM